MAETIDLEQYKAIHRKAMLAGAAKALGLVQRVPELMRTRGWPADDQDLVAVLITAVACRKWGAGREVFRRPKAADGLGGLWPLHAQRVTANHIVDTLELDDLLSPR